MCSVLLFVALVLTHCLECVLFDSLLRLSLSLLCVCSVSLFVTLVPRALFCVLCLIVCYVSVSRTVCVFCLIVCYFSVSRTVLCVLFDCLSR